MSFPVVTNSGAQIGTGLIYSNVVYFLPLSISSQGSTRTVTWTVPSGITTVRVRVWGAGGASFYNGGYYSGAGGGFAIKTITGLTPGTNITVTIGDGGSGGSNPGTGGTSSFGAYVSATGGRNAGSGGSVFGGLGSGGDVNMYGCGPYGSTNGGHVGNLFMPFSGTTNDYGGIFSISPMSTPANGLDKIGTGYLFGLPTTNAIFGASNQGSVTSVPAPNASYFGNGVGGGAQSGTYYGTFPGGGGGLWSSNAISGGAGLVIVEY
jgi:hypothetical protein